MNKEKMGAFMVQVMGNLAGGMTVGLAHLGVKTGLFEVMAGKGPMAAEQVSAGAGLNHRYVEEWLRGMVAAGYLEYDPAAGTFTLPEEHAHLLASKGTDHYLGGAFYGLPGLLGSAPQIVQAFREGGGVPFSAMDDAGIEALDIQNRGIYEQRLVGYWLQKMPAVVAALESGGRALDVGCGMGRVSMVLAQAFPKSRFVGLDPNLRSIELARQAAGEAALGDRLEFRAGTVDSLPPEEKFDLITACDCVHDFADPLGTLGDIRARLAPGGTFFVIEPKVADRLEDNINPIATMFYGFSIFHCMTQSLAGGGAGLGTCMGPAAAEKLMREAGFASFAILDIKSPVNLFYAVGL